MMLIGIIWELVSSFFSSAKMNCCLHSLSYDWLLFQTYSASMARKIYLRGGLGVGAFKRIYGGSKRNGSRPPHFCESSGAIARHILQQLQEMNIVDVDPKGWVHSSYRFGPYIQWFKFNANWLYLMIQPSSVFCTDFKLFDPKL